ncbi:MAG: outer membrane beta-barrel protein, partial [Flavobacterium sp.]
VKDSFNTFDFGVNFGLGYKLENGLNFGVRYNLGLTDINNVDNSSVKNKNRAFQVSVGYFFF